MISEDAVTLNPRMPLLISLRSVITVFDCSGTGCFLMTAAPNLFRTDLDLLFGCLLEWGLPLSLPYQLERIEGCTVHTYNDGDLIACFDENVPDSVVKIIARRQPLRVVFRDSSFASSPAKINVTEIFKLLAPDTRVKVL